MDFKRKMTGLITAFCCFCFIMIFPVFVNAGTSNIAGGSCGDNATWYLTTEGTMVIEGSGAAGGNALNITGSYNGQIKKVIVKEGITELRYYAFAYAGNIESVILPKSLTQIQDSVFFDCGSLKSIEFKSGLTYIGSRAFQNCGSLEKVVLPDTLQYIGSHAFQNCGSLKSVFIPDSVTELDGYGEQFSGCTSLVDVHLSKNCEHIPRWCFSGCTALQSVTVPNGVKSLSNGWGAFQDCSGLKKISLPSTLEAINESTFRNCTGLEEIIIPDRTTYIGNSAFNNCSSLSSVMIGRNAAELGARAFLDCTSLKKIYFKGDAPGFGEDALGNVTAEAYYPKGNSTWTNDKRTNHGAGTIDWNEWNVPFEDYEISMTSSFTYNGKAQMPKITVHCGSLILKKGTDYTVSYSNNVNAGTASVTVKGCGNYSGSLKKNFTIKKASIGKYTARLRKTSYVYNGKTHKPAVTVSGLSSSNYSTVYYGGRNVGKAVIKITGKGNYKGTITKFYKIVPKGTSFKKVKGFRGGFKVKWKKAAGQADRYEFQYSIKKNFSNYPVSYTYSKRTTSVKFTGFFIAGKRYYVRVRTYKNVNGINYYSSWSKVKKVRIKR